MSLYVHIVDKKRKRIHRPICKVAAQIEIKYFILVVNQYDNSMKSQFCLGWFGVSARESLLVDLHQLHPLLLDQVVLYLPGGRPV